MAGARHYARVAEAMVLLATARLLVARVPLERWSRRLGPRRPGRAGDQMGGPLRDPTVRAVRSAVVRAVQRLPGTTKCLPIAMATCWMLRRQSKACSLVIGIAAQQDRGGIDDLHAWVRQDDAILGEMPGEYRPIAAFG